MLLNKGLIKGGDLNNAIVYVDKPLSNETMETKKPSIRIRFRLNPMGF